MLRAATALVAAIGGTAILASSAVANAPPVGTLPNGPISTLQTQKGQLVAFALPHRAGGRVWRIKGSVNASVLSQVSEADVGSNVVLVFKATGPGTTTVSFGLTRGERTKAYESRRFTVRVS